MRKPTTYLIILVSSLLFTLPTFAQDAVDVDLGDIPAGQQRVISYNATVNENLPEGLLFIHNQGRVTGSNFDTVLSDDPQTNVGGDSTDTAVGFTLSVAELPSTGELPWARNLLISALLALILSLGFYAVNRRTSVE